MGETKIETEKDIIKRETKIFRRNTIPSLLIISLTFFILCLICAFVLCQSIVSHYLLGITSAFFGLTWRSFFFRNDFDSDENGKIYPTEKQHKIIREAYFLKYPLIIALYSIISVSLIHLLSVKTEEITLIHILLLSASNIVVGLFVKYPKLF